MEPLTETSVHSALTSVAGNLTYAAQLLGVTRAELIDFVARRPPLRELVEDFRNAMVDDAQALLRAAVVEQQPWALKLVLRTQGRRRGYGQRVDPLETWKPPPEPEPVWERLSEEEFARMVEIHQEILRKQEQGDTEAVASALSPPTADHSPTTTPAPTEEIVRTALVKFKGHLTNAAAELRMTRGVLERHIERRPIFQALLANFRDEMIDHAETGLRMALGQKAPWAIQLVLDTIVNIRRSRYA